MVTSALKVAESCSLWLQISSKTDMWTDVANRTHVNTQKASAGQHCTSKQVKPVQLNMNPCLFEPLAVYLPVKRTSCCAFACEESHKQSFKAEQRRRGKVMTPVILSMCMQIQKDMARYIARPTLVDQGAGCTQAMM